MNVFRLCIVGHSVSDVNGVLEISFDVVGSIGNIYKTVIGKVPYCSCPDNLKGNQCKHICYGMSGLLLCLVIFKTIDTDGTSSFSKCPQSACPSAVPASFLINSEWCLKFAPKQKGKKDAKLYLAYRNFAKCTKDHLSAVNSPNPRRTSMATGSQSKANAPSASWNSSPKRKISFGAGLVVGITSTKPVSGSGRIPSKHMESAVSIGKALFLVVV